MPFSDSKVFRYRYEFAEKPLKDFIRERYFRNQEQPDLREVIAQRVRLNGHPVHNGTVVAKGDWIEYLHLRRDEEERNIHLTVLYEDEWIIAISKPDFLPVIPNTQFYYNSLAILVKERFNDREISPIHRLDIETSGVLLFGKAKKARREMQLLFQERKIEKRYQAVVFGTPNVNSIAGNLIPAKKSRIHTKLELELSDEPNSLTLIEKQKAWGDYFRLWLKPITGKTNQIRVHLAAIGCPIVGDKKYYPDEEIFLDWFAHRDVFRILPVLKLQRQALHCESLSFASPFAGEQIDIVDHTPDWEKKISQLL